MAQDQANEVRPSNPIEKSGFPENRVFQKIQGEFIKVGSVINVGGQDNWWNLASAHDIRPWELIWFNFETYVPEEVNWYLREYVGCHVLSPDGHNYTFRDAKPGRILMPWGNQVNQLLIDRAQQRKVKEKPTMLDVHWPDHKSDIDKGQQLVKQLKKRLHKEVSDWARNPHAFNLERELGDLIPTPTSPGPSSIHQQLFMALQESLFHMIHPKNQEVRRLRERIYSAFSAGVASTIFDQYNPQDVGRSGYERVFFGRGREYVRSLTKLERYQLTIGLIENDRHSGLEGFRPLHYTKEMYQTRMRGRTLQHMLENEFHSNEYLFRQAQ